MKKAMPIKTVRKNKGKNKKIFSRILIWALIAATLGVGGYLIGKKGIQVSVNFSDPSASTTPAPQGDDIKVDEQEEEKEKENLEEYDDALNLEKEDARVKLILKEFKERGFTAEDFKVAGVDESNLEEFVRWLLRINNAGEVENTDTSEIRYAHDAFTGLLFSMILEPASDYQTGNWKGNYRFFPMALFTLDNRGSEYVKTNDKYLEALLSGSKENVMVNAQKLMSYITESQDLRGKVGGPDVARAELKLHVGYRIIYNNIILTFIGTIDKNGEITYTYPNDVCNGAIVTANEVLRNGAKGCEENVGTLYDNSIAAGKDELDKAKQKALHLVLEQQGGE